ncbi:MAG: TonB-dependent receptor [bacterium]|nr:TonB-dependent receptor [bacterium]
MKKLLVLGLVLGLGKVFGADGTPTIMVYGEEVVVTARRIAEKVKDTPVSVTVITREKIKASGAATVVEVLRGVPGLDIAQTGAFGGAASCFLRGAKSEHTLVMIDGVEVNDPISPGRGFDFGHLSTAGIEQIEIIRGSHGIFYGSDAIGGVINIITRKGEKSAFSMSAEEGKYNTKQKMVEMSIAEGPFNYNFAVAMQDSDGISKAAGGTETDGYHSTTVLGNFGFTPSENIKINLSANYNKANFDIDYGASDDDPNFTSNSESMVLKGEIDMASASWLKGKIILSVFKIKRGDDNGTDTTKPFDWSTAWYRGKNTKIAWQQEISPDTKPVGFDFIYGIEHEEEEGESYWDGEGTGTWGWWSSTDKLEKKKENNTGYYFQGKLKTKNIDFSAGARLDDHSRFGEKMTYRISCLRKVEKTRIRASWATGFKAPSLYQLYSAYGTTSLEPDESTSYELGIKQEIGKRALIGFTYFQNKFKNMVGYDFVTWKYKNIGQAETDGVETLIHVRPTDNLTFEANYTYTHTEDKATGLPLLKRPKYKSGFNLCYSPKKANINLSWIHIGKREDVGQITLPSYELVNLNASYNLTDWFSLFCRAENLFDEEYEEVKGYNTLGRSFYTGIKIGF